MPGPYGLTVGSRREDCALTLERHPRGRGGGELARFAVRGASSPEAGGGGQKVALEPGRWYDLRIVAIGSELRAELDGALLCLVRDDRRHGGALSLDVLRGGAAFKEVACRHLGRDGRGQH